MDLIHIAERIREIRRKQSLTVAQLADKSGFSKAFISRLENFRVSASVNALNKITEALGITMAELFQEEGIESPEFLFGHIDEGEEVERDESGRFGIDYHALFYRKLDKELNPFVLVYSEADAQREFLAHENDEFFLLLEGELDFYVGDMGNVRRMKPGDTLYLSRNVPHSTRLPAGVKRAKALAVYARSQE